MKRILLVDDDPLVLRLYGQSLSAHGLQVETAADGVAAMKSLRAAPPDLMVLDLMMPKLSGVEVLKFIRSQPALAALPVVVLSNSYMNELSREAALAGAQKALLKVSCTPSLLLATIDGVLAGEATTIDPSQLLAAEMPKAAFESAALKAEETVATPRPAERPPQSAAERRDGDKEVRASTRRDFLAQAGANSGTLRSLFQSFSGARGEKERGVRLENLYRKVHFIAATAGLAECNYLAQMACAFEALLFELSARPDLISPSVLHTLSVTMDFMERLLERESDMEGAAPPAKRVLVVDDDAVSNRFTVSALRNAGLEARSTDKPQTALEWLKTQRYDLVLLDIEMPGMDGFEVCRRLRELPGYDRTPVVYVTSHGDFESRAKGELSGGNDLIAKPVFPLELAVKAVTHLLKSQLEL